MFWIKLSVSKSILAVASSKITILDFLSIARAKLKSYACPDENKLLLSSTSEYIPFGREETYSIN